MALKSNCTVASWGSTYNGQDVVPGGLHNVTAIGAGDFFSLAVVNEDSTPPVTGVALGPAASNGTNGWYTSPVTVTIKRLGPDDTSATIQTRCVLDPGTTPTGFTDLLSPNCRYLGSGAVVGGDGMHTAPGHRPRAGCTPYNSKHCRDRSGR